VPGGKDRWRITLESVDSPGRQRCALDAGTLSTLTATHLGEPDSGGALCRQRGDQRIQCRAVTGNSFKAISAVLYPTAFA